LPCQLSDVVPLRWIEGIHHVLRDLVKWGGEQLWHPGSFVTWQSNTTTFHVRLGQSAAGEQREFPVKVHETPDRE